MQEYQKQFIQLAIQYEALKFGEFTLKSGRTSPYFFNAGQFNSGAGLAQLGKFYAQALCESGVEFDMLFGPAYKGIPLASTTAIAYSELYKQDIPYCFNRKEKKDHGEGGTLVGAPLEGKAVIIDDVITAGTAVREVLSIIKEAGAQTAAIVIGLNRQERGQNEKSAIAELEETTGIPVISIISLDDILAYLSDSSIDEQIVSNIKAYRDTYGV